jgi:hypothetical protein
MYISVLVSLFFGVFFSGVLLNKFELILIKVLIPIINYIKRNNNDPYQLKIVYYVVEETTHTQYKSTDDKLVEEDLSEEDRSEEDRSEEDDDSEEEKQEKEEQSPPENDSQNEVVLGEESENNDIDNLLNKINSINTKSNVVYLDAKLD